MNLKLPERTDFQTSDPGSAPDSSLADPLLARLIEAWTNLSHILKIAIIKIITPDGQDAPIAPPHRHTETRRRLKSNMRGTKRKRPYAYEREVSIDQAAWTFCLPNR